MARRPSYLNLLETGGLSLRVEKLEQLLENCTVCPHECRIDRGREIGRCSTSRSAVVASWTPHFGEEPIISGRHGSGTVFMANCNLQCAYCQNHEISQQPRSFKGVSTSTTELAGIFLKLQAEGCHNVNWVSPTHQAPQLVRALELAAGEGLRIPIVYNSNGYDSVDVLRLLDGIVDVYMPDLKYADPDAGVEYSHAPDYPARSREALQEMFSQVGDAQILGQHGTLQRGLLIRMLVLPNQIADIPQSLRWISENLSPRVTISLMAQYYPSHKATATDRYPLLARSISAGEWARAVEALEDFMGGDHHYVQNHQQAPRYYRPDFSDRERPFEDVRDFEGDG